MDRNLITEVANQMVVEHEVTENPATGTITIAFAPIAKGEFYDPAKGTARPIAFARKFVREIVKYNNNTLPAGLVGERDRLEDGSAGNAVKFTFGVEGGKLPSGWLPKKLRTGKPAEIVELEAALPGLGGANPLEIRYFNSSVNEGIVISDERIPCGIQFVVDEESGLIARFLKHSAVGGKKTWIDRPLDNPQAALNLVTTLLSL